MTSATRSAWTRLGFAQGSQERLVVIAGPAAFVSLSSLDMKLPNDAQSGGQDRRGLRAGDRHEAVTLVPQDGSGRQVRARSSAG